MKAIAGKTSYSILSIQEYGNRATAKVETTLADVSGLVADAFRAAFSGALRDDAKAEDFEKKLAAKYENEDLPTTTTTQEMTLIKESDGWRVFMNWKAEEQISTLLSQAKKLKKEKNLGAALETYASGLGA